MAKVPGYKKEISKERTLANANVQPQERKELVPEGITCPEGTWIKEAAILLAQKTHGKIWQEKKEKQILQELAHALITTPEIELFTIDSSQGEKKALVRSYLRGRHAIKSFSQGFIPFTNDFHTSKIEGYFIFLNKEHFQDFLAENLIKSQIIKNNTQADDNLYTPPYIAFMLKAVKALDLTPHHRINKGDVETWLKENWPDDLDGISDAMIRHMATFLRRPEDKKGGNTPWK